MAPLQSGASERCRGAGSKPRGVRGDPSLAGLPPASWESPGTGHPRGGTGNSQSRPPGSAERRGPGARLAPEPLALDRRLCAVGRSHDPAAVLTTPPRCSQSSAGNPGAASRSVLRPPRAAALFERPGTVRPWQHQHRSRCCEAPGLRAEPQLRDVPADLHVRVINRAGRTHWHLPSFLKIAFPPRILKRSLLLSMLFPAGHADVPASLQPGTRQQLPAHRPALGGLAGAVGCPAGTHVRAQVLPGQRRAVPRPGRRWGGVRRKGGTRC